MPAEELGAPAEEDESGGFESRGRYRSSLPPVQPESTVAHEKGGPFA